MNWGLCESENYVYGLSSYDMCSDVTGLTTSTKTRFLRVQGGMKYRIVLGQFYKLKHMTHLECTILYAAHNNNDIHVNIQ